MYRLLLIPIVLAALLGGAMVWSGSAAGRPADFTFINRGENGTLDPNNMSWMQDIRIAYALWEGLYTCDPVTMAPIPGAADRISVSDDKRIYTFHIRADARWTNGDPVTSSDFMFAWRRMLEQPGDYTYLHYYIAGAKQYSEDFLANKPVDFNSVGIRAPDPQTFVVTLTDPVLFFPSLCAFPPFFPLNERSMRDFVQVDEKTNRKSYDARFTRPPALVTNGPYELTEWSFKKRLRMRASKYYWDRANVKSQVIDQVYCEDPLAAYLRYNSGSVDWLAEVSGDIAAELRKAGRKDLSVFPGFGSYFYSVNCEPKLPDGATNPLADVRIRQALALSVDKRPIVENVTRMGEKTTDTFIPDGIFPGYKSPGGLSFDPERARKLLAEAGYPDGKGFPLLSILFNSEGQHGQIAQIVQQQWQANLHIQFALENVELKIFRERLHHKDYAIARASWYGDYEDPSTFTDTRLSDSDNNDSGWKSAPYDALCDQATREADPVKRYALLSQAEKIMCDEVAIIPLYSYVNVYLFHANVHGIATDPRNMIMFKSVYADH